MIRILPLFAFLGLAALVISSCSKDCPSCPCTPVTNYDIFLTGEQNMRYPIYVYNTKKQAIFDTLEIPNLENLIDMAISGDGTKLITAAYQECGDLCVKYGLTVYDLKTMDTVVSYPTGRRIEVSNTGRYIAIYDRDSLLFLDGQTFQVLFTDTIYTDFVRFLLDDSKCYCIRGAHEIRIYDMQSRALADTLHYRDRSGNAPAVFAVQPNADGSKLYLFAIYDPVYAYVTAYLPKTDSTSMTYTLIYPGGDIRLTPDGRQIIVTDPGNMDQAGSADVLFFDPSSDVLLAIAPAGSVLGGRNGGRLPTGFSPHRLEITPDSRFTAVAASYGPIFGIVDNSLHEFIDVQYFPTSPSNFELVSCQKIRR